MGFCLPTLGRYDIVSASGLVTRWKDPSNLFPAKLIFPCFKSEQRLAEEMGRREKTSPKTDYDQLSQGLFRSKSSSLWPQPASLPQTIGASKSQSNVASR